MHWVSRLLMRLHQSTQPTPRQIFYTGICHVSFASLPQPGQSLMLCRMLPSFPMTGKSRNFFWGVRVLFCFFVFVFRLFAWLVFFLVSVQSLHSFSCLVGSKGGLCCGMFVLESCGSVSTGVPLHVGQAGKNVNCDVMSVNSVGTTGTCIPSAFSYHKEGQTSKLLQRSQCTRSTQPSVCFHTIQFWVLPAPRKLLAIQFSTNKIMRQSLTHLCPKWFALIFPI